MMSSETIEDLSLKELVRIFRLLDSLEADKDKPRSVLIGGWAVFSYNAYHKSVDVDILTPNKVRDSLIKDLKSHHGYELRPLEEGEKPHLYKPFGNQKVIVDFINPNIPYNFPGKSDALVHSFIYGRLRKAALGSITVPVPERTALLVTKLKAAWDRGVKLDTYRSRDRAFDEGKIVKDQSDILALIDRERGGVDIDLDFLSTMLDKHPFLRTVLVASGKSKSAAELYGKPPDEAAGTVQTLLMLLSK